MPKKATANKPPAPFAIQQLITPEITRNASTAPTFYCNNIAVQSGPVDVWIFLNEIIPNGEGLLVERKANVVMSTGQFFAVVGMLNQQAQKLTDQMQQALVAQAPSSEVTKPPVAPDKR